jgi:integrase
MPDLGNFKPGNFGSFKEGFNDSALPIREDVASHGARSPFISTVGKALKPSYPNYRNAECCVSEGEMKNLAAALESEKRAAGATTPIQPEVRAKLIEFLWWMKKQGYAESTITGRVKALEVLCRRGANLYDPESVKEAIAKQGWSEGRKGSIIKAYNCWLRMVGGSWSPPLIREVEKLPFIPTEQELDSLIAKSGGKLAVFLQLLKETGMRAGEAWSLKWTDIDFEAGTVRVTPEKGSNARCFRLSSRLLAMLNRMEKKNDWVFKPWKLQNMRRTYERNRNRLAIQLCNPRLKQITFHTFRHWKATMEYAKTKDILHVMQVLGHKNIKNTLRYTQLVNFKEDDFVCKAAKTVQEASQLIEAGFEYVCEVDGVKLFRKRK